MTIVVLTLHYLVTKENLRCCFGANMVDQSEDWTLPGGFRGLEVGEEGEPEEATEANVDCTEVRGDKLEVDGCKDGPNAHTRNTFKLI